LAGPCADDPQPAADNIAANNRSAENHFI
jgi:hypothetical protein